MTAFKIKNGLILGDTTEITSILDEDAFASNSATALATQQSIKAYVDATVAATNELVEDSTPQLGGDLASNGNDILMADSDKIQLGTGNDLQIYHDGSNSYIDDAGTGTLNLRASSAINLQTPGGAASLATFSENGANTFYYNGASKLATTNTGVTVTGTVTADGISLGDNETINVGASNDLRIYHDGSNSRIGDFGTGDLIIFGSTNVLVNDPSGNEMIRATSGGAVTLKYNNATKVETTSTGIDVTGEVLADKAYIAEATLTDGATVAWNMSTQSVAKVTLGGNRALSAPSNGSTGQFASLLVIQDGTGSRTLTWNAVYEFKDDTAPTLTTTASKGDLFVFRYNGSKWLEVGRNLNLTLS